MVQCDSCNVWQHGACMGYLTPAECPEIYYCELCHPELHANLVRSLPISYLSMSATSHAQRFRSLRNLRKPRQSHANDAPSNVANPSATTSNSRSSRSHSPLHRTKSPKRRITMNSRDAAYQSARYLAENGEDDPNMDPDQSGASATLDADGEDLSKRKRKRKSVAENAFDADLCVPMSRFRALFEKS